MSFIKDNLSIDYIVALSSNKHFKLQYKGTSHTLNCNIKETVTL